MPVVGRLTTVVDSRVLIFVGLCINAYAVYLMHLYTPQIDYVTAWWPRFIQGFGLGTTFVSLTTLTMSRISQEKMGNATGIFNLMRNLGGSFGIATDLGSNWHLWKAPQALAGLYQEVQKQAQTLAFCDDYWFFTIVFLLLLPLVFLMRRSPRHEEEPGIEALP
jgi:MFS family permease